MRLIPALLCERLVTQGSRPFAALLPLLLFPENLVAQGPPVETGSHIPIWIWFIGTAILGLVLAYGIMRNKGRSRTQKQITEEATKNLYAKEERDRVKSGAD
jgi:hypothetical protein